MNGSAIGQAVLAIAMAAGAYLVLIYFQQYFGQGLRYRQMFFVHWTEFLCLALACWSLFALFCEVAEVLSPGCVPSATAHSRGACRRTMRASNSWWSALRVKGRQYGDERGAIRAERLIGEFRASGDVASVAALLSAESEAAQVEIGFQLCAGQGFCLDNPLTGPDRDNPRHWASLERVRHLPCIRLSKAGGSPGRSLPGHLQPRLCFRGHAGRGFADRDCLRDLSAAPSQRESCS